MNGELLDLTPREFEILRVLLAHLRTDRHQGPLLRSVWGEAYQGETATSTCTSASCDASWPRPIRSGALRGLIVTEPGVGYRIAATLDTL